MKYIKLIASFCFVFSISLKAQNPPVQNQTTGNFYSTIQSAIDSATTGDILVAETGTYFESINFYGKNVVLASKFMFSSDSFFIENTILNSDTLGTALTFTNGEDSTCRIIGFTITSKSGTADTNFSNPVGFAVYTVNSAPKFEYCWFKDTKLPTSGLAQTIFSKKSDLYFEKCLFKNNEKIILSYGGKITLKNSKIQSNKDYQVKCFDSTIVYCANCQFSGNYDYYDYYQWETSVHGWILGNKVTAMVENCTFDIGYHPYTSKYFSVSNSTIHLRNVTAEGWGTFLNAMEVNIILEEFKYTGSTEWNEYAIMYTASDPNILRMEKCQFYNIDQPILYSNGSAKVIINKTTFVSNRSGYYAGAIRSYSDELYLTNSIILYNYESIQNVGYYEYNIDWLGGTLFAHNSSYRHVEKSLNSNINAIDCYSPENNIFKVLPSWNNSGAKYKWNSKTIDGGKDTIIINGVLCSALDTSDYLDDAPDMGYHEYTFNPTSDYDLAIFELLHPIGDNLGLTANEKIAFSVFNNGVFDITGFTVNYYMDSQIDFSFVVNDTIMAGEFHNVVFPYCTDFSQPKQYNLTIAVNIPNDADQTNDSVKFKIFSGTTVDQFPYYEDFESTTGGWIPGGYRCTWEHGIPDNLYSPGPISGSPNCWMTNLDGIAKTDEKSYVLSPVFDFSNLVQPILEFDFNNPAASMNVGVVALQYCTDGCNWQQLGNLGDTGNWYNSSTYSFSNLTFFGHVTHCWHGLYWYWYHCSHELFSLAGESQVQFRYIYANAFYTFGFSYVFSEGASFDNFEIYDANPIIVNSENQEFDLKIYPNPAKDAVFVEAENLNDSKVSMFSLDGKEIEIPVSKLSDSQLIIDVRELTQGVYFLRIENSENTVFEKIIINK